MRVLRSLSIATLLLASASVLKAQGISDRAPAPRRSAPLRAVDAPYRSYVGINPLGVPAGFFNVEWERLTRNGVSVGLTFTHDDTFYGDGDSFEFSSDSDGERETSAELKLRYYPSEGVNLSGLSLGTSFGVSRMHGRIYDPCTQFTCQNGPPPYTEATEVGPTVGVLVDYNWLIGRRKRVLIGLGLGAKRWFGDTSESEDFNFNTRPQTLMIERSQATARFVVGFAY